MAPATDRSDLIQALSTVLERAVAAPSEAERRAEQDELARLGTELLQEPSAADRIGDLFDAVVGTNADHRQERIAVLEESWAEIGR